MNGPGCFLFMDKTTKQEYNVTILGRNRLQDPSYFDKYVDSFYKLELFIILRFIKFSAIETKIHVATLCQDILYKLFIKEYQKRD